MNISVAAVVLIKRACRNLKRFCMLRRYKRIVDHQNKILELARKKKAEQEDIWFLGDDIELGEIDNG